MRLRIYAQTHSRAYAFMLSRIYAQTHLRANAITR